MVTNINRNFEVKNVIKEIDRSDIPNCVSVIRDSFMTVADEFGFTSENAPRFTAFAVSDDRLYYQSDNEHRIMVAYYLDNKIVGYYSLLLQEDNQCELNNLSVLPDYRHNNIGTALLDDAIIRAKKWGALK